VTAVFCASRAQTRAALRALTPGRGPSGRPGIAVVGFGDLELADLVSPPVSVVGFDPVLIGQTAGELLIRRLAGEREAPRVAQIRSG
jgi:LacI family transcriptional regulator